MSAAEHVPGARSPDSELIDVKVIHTLSSFNSIPGHARNRSPGGLQFCTTNLGAHVLQNQINRPCEPLRFDAVSSIQRRVPLRR